jgi:hypothetical protein
MQNNGGKKSLLVEGKHQGLHQVMTFVAQIAKQEEISCKKLTK